MLINCYQILRISNDANENEIKKAFRKLAIQYHPDKNKSINAQNEFIKIKKAYDILSNPKTKYIHDQELFIFKNPTKESTTSNDFKENTKYKQPDSYSNKEDRKSAKGNVYIFVTLVLFLIILMYYFFTHDRSDKSIKNQIRSNENNMDSSYMETKKIQEQLKNIETVTPKSGELKF